MTLSPSSYLLHYYLPLMSASLFSLSLALLLPQRKRNSGKFPWPCRDLTTQNWSSTFKTVFYHIFFKEGEEERKMASVAAPYIILSRLWHSFINTLQSLLHLAALLSGPLEVPNYSTYTLAHSLSFSASPKTQWHTDNRERYERRTFHSHAAINKEAAPLEGRSKVSAQHIAREYAISSS